MATWAIAYDLDVGGMKKAGFSKSQVTQFYNTVRTCLSSNNFEKFKQLSIYTSEAANTLTNAFQVCQALQTIGDNKKYIKRLHLFRVEDLNDLLPLVCAKASADKDRIEEEIDEVFEATGS